MTQALSRIHAAERGVWVTPPREWEAQQVLNRNVFERPEHWRITNKSRPGLDSPRVQAARVFDVAPLA